MVRPTVLARLSLLGIFWMPGTQAEMGTGQVRTSQTQTARPSLWAPMDARRLGLAESMLKYCTRTDPPDAARLRQKIAHLWQGAPEPQVLQVRSSTEYLSAYKAVTDFVTKVDDHNARRPCRELLAANK